MLTLASCESFKNIGTEIKEPFTGKSYQTNKRYFRGSASGESIDMSNSKDKAMLIAKQRLAASVQTTMKSVTDRYVGERNIGTAYDEKEKFESLTREVLNQLIADISIIGEKTFAKKEGKGYICYIALEAKKENVYSAMERNILSRKEAAKIDLDKALFKKIFDQEMDKLGDE